MLSNPAFATDKAGWDFILVGTDYDAVVANRFTNGGRALGQVLTPEPRSGRPQVRIHVRRWRDIIDENRRRLNFMTSNLERDPTPGEASGGLWPLNRLHEDPFIGKGVRHGRWRPVSGGGVPGNS